MSPGKQATWRPFRPDSHLNPGQDPPGRGRSPQPGPWLMARELEPSWVASHWQLGQEP